ncbi:MAG: hypothetical protein WA944_23185 [Mycobacterium sp.]
MSRHAVISRAGIAGPALAHQLATRGWQTTVIERSAQRRDEGQNIDVRGAARDVVRRWASNRTSARPPITASTQGSSTSPTKGTASRSP